jgi:hypothetical protein
MKKAFGLIMCLLMIASAALPAVAQNPRGRYYGGARQYERTENTARARYNRRAQGDRRYDGRSFWSKHRDKLTVAAGSGAGAAIGGLAGGKKGAVIGALLGAGGSALYTYKLRDRDNGRYYRRR